MIAFPPGVSVSWPRVVLCQAAQPTQVEVDQPVTTMGPERTEMEWRGAGTSLQGFIMNTPVLLLPLRANTSKFLWAPAPHSGVLFLFPPLPLSVPALTLQSHASTPPPPYLLASV